MRSKIKGKSTKIPSPFDTIDHKTERSGVAVLMHWMRNIIEEKGLDLGLPDVETAGSDRKMPDTVIYETRRSKNILCVIEAKPPYFDVFNYEELKKPAWDKANGRKAKYFAVTNFKTLIWYNTEKVNKGLSEEEQIVEKYSLSEIENLDNLEDIRFKEPIKRGLEQFLVKLYSVYTGKEEEPRQAIDEFLVFRLHQEIKILSAYYRDIIEDIYHKDSDFAARLRNWFTQQEWTFTGQSRDFDKAARQTAYLLVNKILFYMVLQSKRPDKLERLEIPQSLFKGASLQKELQKYFDQILEIDYETIYTTDFIDTVAFPDVKEVVIEIKKLVNILDRYDFSKIGYDVIGRIFEQLIPQEERHNLGQYFTHPDVVDLILRFCLYHEDDKVFDPACGSGTFLVRAYQHKKIMNNMKSHNEILDTLWGNDIAKFPAMLATINLAINDLSVDENYPNILQEDFFDLLVGEEGFDPEKWRKKRAITLKKEEREIIHPRWFNAIVGNPPYIRHEEGEDKEKWYSVLIDLNGKKVANISKNAGIYVYFFIHGTKFLRDGGYFGFIVFNSWLDVDYGKGLQEFFLKNYKIITIIESKVERWFEEADINTCIVILQKCKNKKERDKNLVRFVYLKKPLREFIPPAKNMWEQEVERLNAIEKLKKTILAHNEFYENEDLRIFPKRQKELWEEGYDPEQKKYTGAKWGKYLRAPKTIIKKVLMNKTLVPLYSYAQAVMEGEPTGANEFFFVTDDTIKKFKLEKSYLQHSFSSPKESTSITITKSNSHKYKIIVHQPKEKLTGTNILKYIEWGEKQGFKKHYFKKNLWYSRNDRKADLMIPRGIYQRFICFYNSDNLIASDRFTEIFLKNKKNNKILCAFFNSTVYFLMLELYCRTNLGEGALDIQPTDIRKIPIPDLEKLDKEVLKTLQSIFKQLSKSNIESIFSELGASSPEEVSLDKVKPDRRELDKIVMGDILGLTEEEQLEVYRAVVDLVKSRIEKAKSVRKKKKTKEGVDIEALTEDILEKIGENTIGKFYKTKILSQKKLKNISLFKPGKKIEIEKSIFGWRVKSGKKYIDCTSEEEAELIKIFIELGFEEVKIPKNQTYIKQILPELKLIKENTEKILSSYLSSIAQRKLREKIKNMVMEKMKAGE